LNLRPLDPQGGPTQRAEQQKHHIRWSRRDHSELFRIVSDSSGPMPAPDPLHTCRLQHRSSKGVAAQSEADQARPGRHRPSVPHVKAHFGTNIFTPVGDAFVAAGIAPRIAIAISTQGFLPIPFAVQGTRMGGSYRSASRNATPRLAALASRARRSGRPCSSKRHTGTLKIDAVGDPVAADDAMQSSGDHGRRRVPEPGPGTTSTDQPS
jgi:hypothetical protein